MKLLKWTFVSALVLGLVGLAMAADEVLLNNGSGVEGEIQSVDESGIVIVANGKTLTLKPSDLDAHDYYEHWTRRVPKDAKAHLRIAVFAYENGLFSQARKHYRKAKSIDKDVVKQFEEEVIPEIMEDVAARLLELARKAVEKEDWNEAERIAATILTRLEDTQAAQQARDVIGSVHLWQVTDDEERVIKRLAKHLPKDEAEAIKVQDRISRKLAPIERKIDKARDRVAKGLRTKTSNRQKNVFQSAARQFEAQIKRLDKLSDEAGDDRALLAHIDEIRNVAKREAVEAYIHAGNVLMVRSSFNDALNMANAALAIDPDNAAAKKFLQETITASQSGGWWGFGRGGRRR